MRRVSAFVFAIVVAGALAAILRAQTPPVQNPGGWTIPPTAAEEKNPVQPTEKVLTAGKKIFTEQCQRCHGVAGKGDGPDADPDYRPDDLSDMKRADRNPDGVMFYKVWNGRAKPKMPAFKNDLTKTEVWTVVLYAKTLRRAS
ncbi:MAG: c-type cytochrome [Vicinamibacterales bacterium]